VFQVVCTGKEERLLDCDFPQDFGVDYDVRVKCTQVGDLHKYSVHVYCVDHHGESGSGLPSFDWT